jgi:hypothetical protein
MSFRQVAFFRHDRYRARGTEQMNLGNFLGRWNASKRDTYQDITGLVQDQLGYRSSALTELWDIRPARTFSGIRAE